MENWIVDRIENGIAVCEGPHSRRDIPLENILGGAEEGSVLVFSPEEKRYTVDPAATSRRRQDIFRKQKALFDKNKSGS